jgi:hypothetical protein
MTIRDHGIPYGIRVVVAPTTRLRDGPGSSRRLAHRLLIVILALMLISCDWGREPAPCECPHLEAAVDEINWAPDLELSLEQRSGSGGGSLETVRLYRGEGVNSTALESRVVAALGTAGYDVTAQPGGAFEGVYGEVSVTVSELVPSASSDFPGIRIAVKYTGKDSPEIDEELDPLRRALATP